MFVSVFAMEDPSANADLPSLCLSFFTALIKSDLRRQNANLQAKAAVSFEASQGCSALFVCWGYETKAVVL